VRNLCRVFLKTNADLRSFFWFAVGVDESVYFSSSNSKKYRRGFHGSGTIPVGGSRIDPEVEGRPSSREEIDNYHSLHHSGIFVLPTMTEGKRQRHIVTHLEKYVGPIPLVAILPMEPLKYPITSRTPKPSSDMVIDISSLLTQPFALMFYIKRRAETHPPVSERHDEWPIYVRGKIPIGYRDLCVVVYANPITFLKWQELEVTMTSQPETQGGELSWPIFSTT